MELEWTRRRLELDAKWAKAEYHSIAAGNDFYDLGGNLHKVKEEPVAARAVRRYYENYGEDLPGAYGWKKNYKKREEPQQAAASKPAVKRRRR